MDGRTVPRKDVAMAKLSSYEQYRAETFAPEVWESAEDLRDPRSWPRFPQRIQRGGPIFFLIVVTDLVVTLTPLVFLGRSAPCLSPLRVEI